MPSLPPVSDAVCHLSLAAERDLLEATQWITKDNPAAARALRNAVKRAAMTIGEHRHIGRLRPEVVGAPYRSLPLIGFSYVIIYNAERIPPRIMRILHGARDLPEFFRDLDTDTRGR
jgi:toxin ParE1/3/4